MEHVFPDIVQKVTEDAENVASIVITDLKPFASQVGLELKSFGLHLVSFALFRAFQPMLQRLKCTVSMGKQVAVAAVAAGAVGVAVLVSARSSWTYDEAVREVWIESVQQLKDFFCKTGPGTLMHLVRGTTEEWTRLAMAGVDARLNRPKKKGV